jgi:hypothetical protein
VSNKKFNKLCEPITTLLNTPSLSFLPGNVYLTTKGSLSPQVLIQTVSQVCSQNYQFQITINSLTVLQSLLVTFQMQINFSFNCNLRVLKFPAFLYTSTSLSASKLEELYHHSPTM